MPGDKNNNETPGAAAETFSIPDGCRRVEIDAESVANLNRLSAVLERMRMGEYLAMLTRPGKVLYFNFLAGLARGLGFGLGMTVLLGLALYLMGQMVDIPLIGEYAAKIVAIVQEELKEIGKSPKF